MRSSDSFWSRTPAAARLLDRALGLLGDEALEVGDLRRVQLDLVEVAFDDLVDELANAGQEFRAGADVEVVEGVGERGDPVDEAAHRVAPGREEGGVAQGDAQHRQLQARDLARHLRRHARVGQDLVEQAADDVDHHVIELAGRGLDQLLAVGADQVDGHQAGEAVVVLAAPPMPAPCRAAHPAAARAAGAVAAVDHRPRARNRRPGRCATRPARVGAADAAAGARAAA